MEPTLRAGDFILVHRWTYRRRPPAAGDVVVLRDPETAGRFLVKRIESGDSRSGFFVLGDNTDRSRDSRHFGRVPMERIVGKVRYRARA